MFASCREGFLELGASVMQMLRMFSGSPGLIDICVAPHHLLMQADNRDGGPTSNTKGGSPGEPRCDFPVMYF